VSRSLRWREPYVTRRHLERVFTANERVVYRCDACRGTFDVDAGVDELVTMAPDEDVSPVALHGVVEDFAGSVDILGVDDLDENYCLQFHFWYSHPSDEQPQLAQVADIEC